MQQHTRPESEALIYGNLPNNTAGAIDPEKLREVLLVLVASYLNLLDDGNPGAGPGSATPGQQQATFGNLGGQAQDNTSLVNYLAGLGHALVEFTPPLLTQARQWYLASSGIWEAKSSFNAQAQPSPGAYWRLVVGFGDALTATAAGKALLAAPTALVQRNLLDIFATTAGQYGTGQPAFTNAYAADGALVYLLKQVDYLRTQMIGLATPAQPAIPTVTGFLPASAEVSASVTLTGTGFTKATAVLFNGTPASFQAVNATTIVAVVPVGATTGSLAVTNSAGTGTSTASFTVKASTVTPPAGDTLAPNISLTVPTAGATLTLGQPVQLTANATDNVGVTGVVFTNGATGAVLGMGTKNGNTYSVAYTPTTAGALTLTATASDAAGNSQAASVTVNVQSATNQPPSVTINGSSSATAGTSQNYQSVASDSDGVVALVELLLMGDASTVTSYSVIGSDDNSPYVVGWTPSAAGTSYLRMRATDDKGAQSFSSVLAVSVQAASGAGGDYITTDYITSDYIN